MLRVKKSEEKYLKAACCLCSEMMAKGCKNVAIHLNKKPVIVKIEDVITFLISGYTHAKTKEEE